MELELYLLNYLGSGSRFDTAYPRDWIQRIGGFLGVGTTFDIFKNIHILYLEYNVLSSSGYGVLIFFPLWSLVSAGTDTPDFPEEFPNDLSGLPPLPEIKFWIELIPRAVPIAKSPYRLAPSELEKLSGQLKEL
ncbi:hypothetical protein Tco_0913713 [Tanacetum coccineum]